MSSALSLVLKLMFVCFGWSPQLIRCDECCCDLMEMDLTVVVCNVTLKVAGRTFPVDGWTCFDIMTACTSVTRGPFLLSS